jgi:CheY-like chemotaxis protein
VLVDLRRVLETSLRMTGNEVRHRARVVRQYGEAPLVEAHELRLAQVFVNLLVNAAHAIEVGESARNEIRLVLGTDDQGRAVVEVHDSGAGIPPEILPHIFEAFFTTRPGQGVGLGLAVSKRIIEDLGGEISVQSGLPEGTVLRVALPAARQPPLDARTRPTPPAGPTRDVLVVDDEPRIGQTLQRLLEPDYRITAVRTIAEAKGLLSAGHRFEVIVCDLMMPEGTGMDLHAHLAHLAPELADRMLFVSGGAFTPAAAEFLSRPNIRSLAKPIDTQELRAALASWRT